MCKYTYEFKRHHLTGLPCIYPDFYERYSSFFSTMTQELILDSEGYCLFHSKNMAWKIQNQIADRFIELLKVTSIISKEPDPPKWIFNFSGFRFNQSPNILNKDNCPKDIALDFRHCIFSAKLKIKDLVLNSINVASATFQEVLDIENVTFTSGINSTDAKFENGLKIYHSKLEGNNYFDNCVFKNQNKNSENNLIFSDVSSDDLNFEDTKFETLTTFQKSIFKEGLNLDNTEFKDEFYFHNNELFGSMSFDKANFSFAEKINPMFSSVDFEKLKLNENSKLSFKGKEPLENMVAGELRLTFAAEPQGLITFENFNLNKIALSSKIKLFELEKLGNVEIGLGCRKYYCQSDIFTIATTKPEQILTLDLINVFCKFFEQKNSYNLGLEIIERKENIIRYFFFTDEMILKEEFDRRLKRNEYDLWQSFSDMTHAAINNLPAVYSVDKNMLIDVAGFFIKIKERINEVDGIFEEHAEKIFSSISADHKSVLDIKEVIAQIHASSRSFYKELPILSICPPVYNNTSVNINGYGHNVSYGQHGDQVIHITNNKEDSESKNLAQKSIRWTKTQTIWTIIGVIIATILAVIALLAS